MSRARRLALVVVPALSAWGLAGSAVPLAAQGAPAAAARPAPPLAPAVAPSGRYDYLLEEDEGERSTGTVRWRGELVRIDSDRPLPVSIEAGERMTESARRASHDVMRDTERRPGRARSRGPAEPKWYLVDRRAGLLHVVNDRRREVETFRLADFEGLVTRVMSAVGGMVRISAEDAGIVVQALGDAGAVAGTPVKRFRVTEKYVQRVRAMGFDADATDVTVTTEYRVPVTDAVPANPLAVLALDAANEGTLLDAAHRAKVAQAKAQLFTAAPLAVDVVREGRDRDDGTVERETARFTVTARSADAGDAARFVLPAGYARRDAKIPGR